MGPPCARHHARRLVERRNPEEADGSVAPPSGREQVLREASALRRRPGAMHSNAPARPRSQVSVRTVVTVASTVIGVAFAAWFLWSTKLSLLLVFVALLLAIAIDALLGWLERHHVPRWAAVTMVVALLLAGLAFLGFFAVPRLVAQVADLVQSWPRLVGGLERSRAYAIVQRYVDVEAVVQRLRERAPAVIGTAFTAVRLTFVTLAAAVTVLFLVLFMLLTGKPLVHALVRQALPGQRARWWDLLEKLRRTLAAYVIGHLSIIALQGVATAIALALAGVPYFIVLGMVSALASLVPFAGVLLAGVGMSLLAWAVSGLWAGVAIAIYYVVYQQVEDHVLYPLVYRESVDLNPLVIVVVLLFLSELWGIAGAIMAVPTAAAGQVILGEVLRARRERLGIP